MGANGSYNKELGGVPVYARTHIDTEMRVDGHKVLLQRANQEQMKVPMNSSSENPIYLCASIDRETRIIRIRTMGIYEKHKLVESIDLEFDNNGNFIPYKKGEKSSHLHKWNISNPEEIGRKSHDKSNVFPIPDQYTSMVEAIEKFNKQKRTW